MKKHTRAVFDTPYKEKETSDCIKFRYIFTQCYEFILPNGTTIITDPFISGALNDFTIDDITGADYIILNHTHFDHDMDVRNIWDKFKGKVICQKEVAMDVAKFFDIPYSSIYAVDQQETYYLPEFTLHTYHGIHDNRKAREGRDNRPSEQDDVTLRRFQVEGHHYLDKCGAVFMLNFVIETNNNFKIAFHAGQDFDNFARHMINMHPNILVRHRIRTCTPEDYAMQCMKVGSQYILPWHHNNAITTGEDLNAYIESVNNVLLNNNSTAKAFNPDPYRWHKIYIGIEAE